MNYCEKHDLNYLQQLTQCPICKLEARVVELEKIAHASYEALGASGWQRGEDSLMDRIHTALNLPE